MRYCTSSLNTSLLAGVLLPLVLCVGSILLPSSPLEHQLISPAPGFLPKVSSNINDFIDMLGFPLTKAVLRLGLLFLLLSDKLLGAVYKDVGRV